MSLVLLLLTQQVARRQKSDRELMLRWRRGGLFRLRLSASHWEIKGSTRLVIGAPCEEDRCVWGTPTRTTNSRGDGSLSQDGLGGRSAQQRATSAGVSIGMGGMMTGLKVTASPESR